MDYRSYTIQIPSVDDDSRQRNTNFVLPTPLRINNIAIVVCSQLKTLTLNMDGFIQF